MYKKGEIYVIRFDEFFKIGRTKNFEKRFNSYRIFYKDPIIVLREKVYDCVFMEKELHKLFKSKNVRNEWFLLDKEDIQTIKDYIKQHNFLEHNENDIEIEGQIIKVRTMFKLFQVDLANIMGVSVNTVRKWESSKSKMSLRNKKKFLEFCKKQGVELKTLF